MLTVTFSIESTHEDRDSFHWLVIISKSQAQSLTPKVALDTSFIKE